MASRDLPLLGPFSPSFSSALAAVAGGGASAGSGVFFLLSRAPPSISFAGRWPWEICQRRRTVVTSSSSAWAGDGGGGEQDHYAVLGLSRSASAADIKRAYRLLAKKHHPDVSNDLQSDEVFKSIKFAYEVLSNEVSRAKYDMLLNFPQVTNNTWRRERAANSEYNRRKKARRWVDDPQVWYEEKQAYSWYQRDSYEEYANYERGPLVEVLRFALFTLFLMKIAGCRASLALYSLSALLDRRLDNGYKVGYVFAWYMGGQGGILLALFLYFSSWLFGKSSSSLVALMVSALWVAGKTSAFVPLPHGAVLTLLYLSIRFQVESK